MKLDANGQPFGSVNALQNSRKAVNELYGLISGMLADRVLTNDEIRFLANWLCHHLQILDEWPIHEIACKVAEILDDNEITEAEARDLALLLDKVIGGDTGDGESGARATRLPVDEVPAPIVFLNRSFCFTGKFQYGERKRCQACTEEAGGTIHNSVTLALDYLVIGTLASRDWAQTNHGRKIEAAVRNRTERRAKTCIVSEEHWIRCLAAANRL
jgi:hypothetical protein